MAIIRGRLLPKVVGKTKTASEMLNVRDDNLAVVTAEVLGDIPPTCVSHE